MASTSGADVLAEEAEDEIAVRGTDVIRELVQNGSPLESRDPYGDMALIAAAKERQKETARWLLNRGADYKFYGC
jgi:ankyrin repeat protein